MKKTVLTYIFNDYDQLRDPSVVTPNWSYVCRTDAPMQANVWRPQVVAHEPPRETDPKRRASLTKIEHYRHVPADCDICVTIDGSTHINTNLDQFLSQHWTPDTDLLIATHPTRSCIYDEAIAVLHAKLDDPSIVIQQMERYAAVGFPRQYGLFGTRMMVKNNRSEQLHLVCQLWADEYRKGSRRDQLSLNFAIWKAEQMGVRLRIRTLNFHWLYRDSGLFRLALHNKSRTWASAN